MRKCNKENCEAFETCEFTGRMETERVGCEAAPVRDKLMDVPDIICKECNACLGGRMCVAFKNGRRSESLACDFIRFFGASYDPMFAKA